MDELMKKIAEHSESKLGYQFYVHGHESNIRTTYAPEVTFQSEVCRRLRNKWIQVENFEN